MFNKLSDWIAQLSSGWTVLVSLIIFLLFSVLVLPDQASKAEVYSGNAGSPDTSLFYTAEELYQFTETYGKEGRTAYIQARYTFDVIWPLVYVFFLASAISWVYKRADPKQKIFQRLNLLPIFGMLFDFCENISTSIVMARYPYTTAVLEHLAGVFTMLKWVSLGGSFIALIFGVALVIWRSFHNKPRSVMRAK